jgi:Zn-dependent protease with chaperone function
MIQFLLIAVFMAMFLRDAAPGPWFHGLSAESVTGAVIGSMLGVWLSAHLYLWRQRRRLDRSGEYRAVMRADIAAAAARLVATFIHIVAVLGFGWLDAVRSAVGNLILVDEFIAAGPVLLVYIGTWWSMYPIERRLREAVLIRDLDEGRGIPAIPSRAGHVFSALRHQAALVLVPVAGVLAWYETVERYAPRLAVTRWIPAAAIEIAGMVVVLSLMPAVMRHVWDTVRLQPGPLRDQLREMCRAHGVRVRELLVWRTQGAMINGAVMGFAGPLRYILLTDALLERLPAEQVEAVMAHELGHVRRRHMLWLAVSMLATVLLVMGVGKSIMDMAPRGWGESAWVDGLIGATGLAAALVLFGFVSRRFEWQADAFAAQHLSGLRQGSGSVQVTEGAAAAMSGALDAVARLNHIPRDRFTWRHGSIRSRQERLAALVGQPADRLPVDRQVRVVKVLAAFALAAAILVVVKTGVS